MPYTKNTWETGDTITAEKLNNLEDGADRIVKVMSVIDEQNTGAYTLDKTWQEIHDALAAGKIVIAYSVNIQWTDPDLATIVPQYILTAEHSGLYTVTYVSVSGQGGSTPMLIGGTWSCSSADDYPYYEVVE